MYCLFRLVLLLLGLTYFKAELLSAQIQQPNISPPSPKNLFEADDSEIQNKREKKIQGILAPEAPRGNDLDFKAPELEYEKEGTLVSGSGGVLISGEGNVVQGDSAKLNLETKDLDITGRVLITNPKGVLSAESGSFNFDTETGEFEGASFELEQGGYQVDSERLKKISETQYQLYDSSFTTCHCPDKYRPWEILGDECTITQEGYAHCYGVSMDMFGVPLFYAPYFGFPVKTERSSGLLVPQLGYGDRHGFIAHVPEFVVLDDSTDSTITPVFETITREGVGVDLRKTFSRYNKLESRLLYSDESLRDGALQGTLIDGLSDPSIDTDRLGGFYRHTWTTLPSSETRAGLFADVHYVSDDLFVREIEDEDIGHRQDLYTTSSIVGRTNIGEYVSSEIAGEYNQALVATDDVTLQRLPEARIEALKSFRPFGYNLFGVKLVTRGRAVTTDFVRDEGYDGWRTDLNPAFSIPFRYKNFFNSAFTLSLDQTYYDLRDTLIPGSTTILESSSDRTLPQFSYQASTAIERVYELEKGNWLTSLTSLGSRNQSNVLARLKHVVEPTLKYLYVPDVSQDQLPFFDAFDRVRERSVVTYGIDTMLLGRFVPRNRGANEISELTPRPQDLPAIDLSQPVDEFGMSSQAPIFGDVGLMQGEIRKLVTFSVRQSYDYKEDQEDNDPNREPFSDIGFDWGLYPTSDLGVAYGMNYSPEDHDLTSWNLALAMRTDRGDVLKSRVTYIREQLSQVEGNLELVLSEQIKAGYYTRYDDLEGEFIENWVGLRFSCSCECWHFDVGVHDTLNPDRQSVLVSFNFGGLGDISQGHTLDRRETQ